MTILVCDSQRGRRLADLGTPVDPEAGFRDPVLVVSAAEVAAVSQVLMVVPITCTHRPHFETEVGPLGDDSGLEVDSWAQVEHLRPVSRRRLDSDPAGSVGPVALVQIREIAAELLGLLD